LRPSEIPVKRPDQDVTTSALKSKSTTSLKVDSTKGDLLGLEVVGSYVGDKVGLADGDLLGLKLEGSLFGGAVGNTKGNFLALNVVGCD